MRYDRQDLKMNYFGEWSEEYNQPHGRGVWFARNFVRVGYYTQQ